MSSMNQWVHIVGTRKYASTTTLYINGVKMSQANITYVPTYNTNNLATIGGSSFAFSNPWFKGTIAGVKIDAVQTWNGSELDQAAVTELYNSGAGQEYPFTVSNVSIVTFNDSVGSNNGTSPVGSVPTFTTGKVGQAFTFDGVNDYIQLPSNSLNFIGDFSISAWAYFPTNYSGSSPMYILSNWNVPSWYTNPNGYFLRAYGNEVAFGIFNNGTAYTVTSSYVFQNNTMPASWHHIAATRKGSAASKLYIDGVLVASNTSTINPTYLTTTNPTIGAINVPGNVGSYPAINGSKIDSVSVWNKTLSDDEIVQLYNAGNGTQYPFSSQTLPSTKNQFAVDNGTLMNGCTLTDGKIGKAFTFDGVNDYVALSDNSLNFIGDFTTSFWFYANAFGSANSFLTCENYVSPNDNGWIIFQYQGNLCLSIYNGTNATGWKTSTTITTGTWYHVVVVKNRSVSPKFYINGALVGTVLRTGTDTTLNPGYVTTQYCSLGTDRYAVSSTQYYLNGKMDGVNVWQREITQAEVTELYNSGNGKQLTVATPIVTNGLVLNLDAGRKSSYPNTGTTWYDISGNGNNGTMTNGPVFGTASGGVINLNGSNQYISVSGLATYLNNKTNFTYETWFKVNSTTTFGTLFSFGNNDNYSNDIIFFVSSNQICLQVNNGVDGGTVTTFTSTDWNSMSVVYDGTQTGNANRLKLYLNGVLQTLTFGTYNVPASTSNTSMVNSGIGVYSTGNWNNLLSGSIGSSRLYNKSLTDTEITQNFNATKTRFGL